jgi:hypothetical protein
VLVQAVVVAPPPIQEFSIPPPPIVDDDMQDERVAPPQEEHVAHNLPEEAQAKELRPKMADIEQVCVSVSRHVRVVIWRLRRE